MDKKIIDFLDAGLPWLSRGAVTFLENNCKRDWQVLEYGAGNSSVFWSLRCHSVFSIEHDRKWGNNIDEYIKLKNIANINLILRPPKFISKEKWKQRDPSNPFDYVSDFSGYKGYSFKKYSRAIDELGIKKFDCIVIDGRSRPSCAFHSFKYLNENGILVFDNYEREHYQKILYCLDNILCWRRLHFDGVPFECFEQDKIFSAIFINDGSSNYDDNIKQIENIFRNNL